MRHWDENNAYRVKLLDETEAGFCVNKLEEGSGNRFLVHAWRSFGVPVSENKTLNP